jgi:hypothetical protein
MSVLNFTWNGLAALADELSKPLTHLSIDWADHAKIHQVSLWRLDGSGLRIHSEMHDVAERREIGVLVFSLVSATVESEQIYPLDSAFHAAVHPSKLVIRESGTSGDSGVILQAENGSEITIVAATFPCFLYVGGLPDLKQSVVPEYALNIYERIRL